MTAGRKGRATSVDFALGRRIRERRIALGLTQQQLAELIGVTYQQANKYEKGVNRVAIGRLAIIAEALDTSLAELVADLKPDARATSETPAHRRLIQLAQAFAKLTLREQTAVLGMVRILAQEHPR